MAAAPWKWPSSCFWPLPPILLVEPDIITRRGFRNAHPGTPAGAKRLVAEASTGPTRDAARNATAMIANAPDAQCLVRQVGMQYPQ